MSNLNGDNENNNNRDYDKNNESYENYFNQFKAMIRNENSSRLKNYLKDELISELSKSLLDQTVINILIMLRLQQINNENELMQHRTTMIEKLDAKRNDMIKKVEKKFASGEIKSNERDDLFKEMKKHYEKKILSIDMHLLNRIEKNVNEQQKTLMDAEIPGFHVTNDVSSSLIYYPDSPNSFMNRINNERCSINCRGRKPIDINSN